MKKRIVLMISIVLLLNVATVYAGAAIYGYYQGFEKVKVYVNGTAVTSDVPGFIIEKTTVVPLRVMAEALNAISKWDEEKQTAYLIKPNVNMQFTANSAIYDKNNVIQIYSPFGKIPPNKRGQLTFFVYTEVDSLPREWIEFKLVLKDPDGEMVKETSVQSYNASQENSLQYIDKFEKVDFVKPGNYRVQFLIKSESTKDNYVKIGEKLILVK